MTQKMTEKEKAEAKKERELTKRIKEAIENKQHKKEKVWSNVIDVVDSVSMFLSAAAGILLSKYMPEFTSGIDIVFIIPSWSRLVMSFILAMGVIAVTEIKGSKAGKRKNFIKRLYFSFSNGMAWHTMLGF